MKKRVKVFWMIKAGSACVKGLKRSFFGAAFCSLLLAMLLSTGLAMPATATAQTALVPVADSAAVAALQDQLNQLQTENNARFEQLQQRLSTLQRELREQNEGFETGIQQQLGIFEELQNRILLLQSGLNESGIQITALEAQLQQQADSLGTLQQLLADQSETFQQVLEANQAQFRQTLTATEQQLGTLSDDFGNQLSESTRMLWVVISILGVVLLLALLYFRNALSAQQQGAKQDLAQAEERLSGGMSEQMAGLEERQRTGQEALAQQLQAGQDALSASLESRAATLEDALITQSQKQQQDTAALNNAIELLKQTCLEKEEGLVKEVLVTAKTMATLIQKQLTLTEETDKAAAERVKLAGLMAAVLPELKSIEETLAKPEPAPDDIEAVLHSLQNLQKQLSGSA